MDLKQARIRIARAQSKGAALSAQEVERLSLSLIDKLPRDGACTAELNWGYQQLINLHIDQGNIPYAFHRFQQYLGDCAQPCDPAFDRLYNDGLIATRTAPTPLKRRERFFSLVNLFRQTLQLDGLVAECGCFRGLSSYLLCSTLKRANGAFDGHGYRIFDSFAGLSAPQAEDAVAAAAAGAADLKQNTQAGNYAASLETVKTSLCAFPRIEYFPGWIPQAFPHEPEARYRFVHVDVDIYQPTRDSLDYFYPRLVPGGIIVCDDYNWPGARKAIEEVCARVGAQYQTTPHMQAYLVRG
jgi:hypothetical protein